MTPGVIRLHKSTSNDIMHIDYIAQVSEATDAWTTFIIDDASGFTRAGVESINESIRTYCWALLGSQSQTRTDVLGTGTAFDAQKQFLANVEDAINSPVDLPSQIARYQNTLKYARSKVDFVFGIGLYMSPSNMELRIGTVQDYNNEIVIATDAQDLGLNDGVNTKSIPPKQTHNVQGTPTRAPKVRALAQTPSQVIAQGLEQMLTTDCCFTERFTTCTRGDTCAGRSRFTETCFTSFTHTQHENNKTALIFGSIVIGVDCIYALQNYLEIHSRAATYNKPATATTRAHKLFPNQLTTFPVVESNHDTIAPITPGNAAAAFPAKFASSLPKLLKCFFFFFFFFFYPFFDSLFVRRFW